MLKFVRIICYLALAAVVLGIGGMYILSATGACPRISTGGIACTTDFYTQLAEFSMTIMLLTVFTGVPALLAMAGVIFLLYDLFQWHGSRAAVAAPSPAGSEQPATGRKPSFLIFLLKCFGFILVATFVLAIIAGMLEG